MIDNDAIQKLAANMLAELPLPAERARLRNLFGISQDELAQTLKVTRRTVYAWEHGNGEPTGPNRVHYAQVLALWAERERSNSNPE